MPHGDTNTTRRLFDAMASACLPLRFTNTLPFKQLLNSKDWNDVSIDMGSTPCCADNLQATTAWLATHLLNDTNNTAYTDQNNFLSDKACRAHRFYLTYLSYRNGAAANSLVNSLL